MHARHPLEPALGPEPLAPRGSHAHLWSAPDGTGLHAPSGRLVSDPSGDHVCCHLCGRRYVALGSHLRRHGHTAASYREAMGLCRSRALSAQPLSAAISARQATAYRENPELRGQLATGQEMARTGQLGWRARRTVSAELRTVQEGSLDCGRRNRAARRAAELAAVVAAAGVPDLSTYLRTAYGGGASLATLARATGLGRERLRHALTEAGVPPRAQGATPAAGRAGRARKAERRAADRVGTDDLSGWLQARRDAGWSLARLGEAVGHSGHWVSWRLPG